MPTAEVSTIIPVRNGAAFIEDALKSVYEQSLAPTEVIVIDDGSEDDTASIVKRFSRVIYEKQPPLGQATARNRGADIASQKYIAFLDADDLWSHKKLELQLAFLAENPEIEIVSGQMIQFSTSDSGQIVQHTEATPANLPGLMLMTRETFWRVGPYSSEWRVGEVIEWWARAIDQNIKAGAIPDVVLKRRIHQHNLGKVAETPIRDYLGILNTIVRRRRGEQA